MKNLQQSVYRSDTTNAFFEELLVFVVIQNLINLSYTKKWQENTN